MKMVNKILSVILTVVMLAGILPMSQIAESDLSGLFVRAFAKSDVSSGSCGKNLTWDLDDAGTLTISGKGAMSDYSSNCPWTGSSVRSVVIDSGVTGIGNRAFYGCTGLSEITVPVGVKKIGSEAFFGCSKLKSIDLPEGLKSIGYFAFGKCTGLTTVTIPSTVTSTDTGWDDETDESCIFYGCTNLKTVCFAEGMTVIPEYVLYHTEYVTKVIIPASVKSIGRCAFWYCTGLADITLPDGLTSIGEMAFSDCTALKKIKLPESLKSIGDHAFSYCSSLTEINVPKATLGDRVFCGCARLKKISFSKGTKTTGTYTFVGCTALNDVILPDSLKSIGVCAFADCTALKNITLPEGLTSIEYGAFSYCENLTEITIPSSVATINVDTESEFDYECSILYGCTNLKTVNFAEGMTAIPDYALKDAEYVTTVNIPESVKSIGDYAFSGCTGLKAITLPGGLTSIGYDAFDGCSGLTKVTIPSGVKSIGSRAFMGCTGLKEIRLPEGLTSIGYATFWRCTGLKQIDLPAGLTYIDSYVFSGCSGLRNIVLPAGLKTIGDGAFSDCTNLTEITIPAGVTDTDFAYDPDEYDTGIFSGCTKLKTVNFAEGMTAIPAGVLQFADYVTTVNIPAGVKKIGAAAFYGCTGLTEIDLPEGLTSIEEFAFAGCGNLTGIIIPESVKRIGGGVFSDCVQLKAITIPSSVVSFGYDYEEDGEKAYYEYGVFSGCKRLADINLPDGLKRIGDRDFMNCVSLAKITIPSGVTSIGEYAFYSCEKLSEIDLPDGLTSIGRDAFSYCENLTEITIPANVTTYSNFDYHYFYGCTKLTTVNFADGMTEIPGILCGAEYVTTVNIPESVKSIGNWAFSSCENLTGITIPSGVTSIGSGAFWGCTGLSEVTLPGGLTSVDDYAFSGCSGLAKVTIPSVVKSIGDYAFSDCSGLTTITIPSGVRSIGDYAFNGCKALKDVYYSASAEEWKHVSVGSYNTPLLKATFHYSHKHSFDDWTVTVEATCTKEGSRCKTCSACGYVETEVIPASGHKYTKWTVTKPATVLEEGSKQRTCTVCGSVETVVIGRIAIDINKDKNYGIAKFTVVNAQTLQPISGATIIVDTDTDGAGTFTTDEAGKSSIVIPVGKQSVTVTAEGCLPRNLNITVAPGENDIPQIGLSDQSVYDAVVRSHEMTYDEIIAAGIDVEEAENNNFVEWELTLKFESYIHPIDSVELITVPLKYYKDKNGVVYGPTNPDSSDAPWRWEPGPDGPDHEPNASPGHFVINYSSETLFVYPVSDYYYILVRGDVHWLKELFDVEMLIINNSATDTLENLTATLMLPDGLSLAAMTDQQQSLEQSVGTIETGSTQSVHWYVRGDKAGEYPISANLSGKVMPFGEKIDVTYKCDNSINVWGSDAFRLDFDCEKTAFYGEEFPIIATLTNVSDKSLYNVEMIVNHIEQGHVTHFSNGHVIRQVEMTDKTPYVVGGLFGEFKPGDSLVIEMSVTAMFIGGLYAWVLPGFAGAVRGWDKITDIRNSFYGLRYGADKYSFGKDIRAKQDEDGTLKTLLVYYSEEFGLSNVSVTSSDDSVVTVEKITSGGDYEPVNDNMHVGTVILKTHNEGSAKITVKASDYPYPVQVNVSVSSTMMKIRYDNNENLGEYPWDDNYFANNANQYNQSLATASMILTLAAFENPKKGKNINGIYVNDLLKEIGFDYGFRFEGHKDGEEIYDRIAGHIGKKELNEDTVVIAVAIRGGGYGLEWGGNFNLGKDDINHRGFDIAKDYVLTEINSFIKKNKLGSKKLKLWITGFSRSAATANLVAAHLINKDSRFSNKNVYAYTFETPKNTVDKNHADSKYNSIFNIVNPIDVVPYVAPEEMGFSRYGVDLYLPTKMDVRYPDSQLAMSQKLKKVFGIDYDESFCFKEFDFEFSLEKGVSVVQDNKTISQASYARNLISVLSKEVFKSRSNYYTNCEKTVVPLTGQLMGKLIDNENNSYDDTVDALLAEIQGAIIDYFLNTTTVSSASDIVDTIINRLNESGLADIQRNNLRSVISDLVMAMVKHINYTLTTFNNMTLLFYPHRPEITMAWMLSDPSFSRTLSFRKIQVNCPVDVDVYDSTGSVAASIVNDVCIGVDGSRISYYIEDNGAKTFELPDDEEYSIVMTATDSGSVTYSVYEYGENGIDLERVVNYYDIPVSKGDVLTGTAENRNGDSECAYPIMDKNNKRISGAEVLKGEIPAHTLTVNNSLGIDGLTVGGGEFTHGEFARVVAGSTDSNKFIGLYVGDKLVSKETVYRFCVKEDMTVTAVYEGHRPGDVDGNGDVLANDARLALRFSAKLEELDKYQQKAADVDGSGDVLANDARQILRFSAKLQSDFTKVS